MPDDPRPADPHAALQTERLILRRWRDSDREPFAGAKTFRENQTFHLDGVAIKTILKTAAMGDGAEERFRREAAAAGKLSHANLVTIFDFDKDGDTLYLVMEYVKGDDLEDLIKRRSLSQSESLELLAQICDGLGFAHRNGILHRDIKPTNVRVLQDGARLHAKVMDFGIARVEDSSLTATGIVVGTVSYLAPEYIQSGKATAQCDLWAVGDREAGVGEPRQGRFFDVLLIEPPRTHLSPRQWPMHVE